jgi:hypothetical protein
MPVHIDNLPGYSFEIVIPSSFTEVADDFKSKNS